MENSTRVLDKLLAVEMPPRIAAMERDHRGFPTPYVSAVVNGKHDFRVVDVERWGEVVAGRKCQLCGAPIEGDLFFIGGPSCMVNGFFFDVHMHEECAHYAIRVCPFLALPKFAYAKAIQADEHTTLIQVASAGDDHPTHFGIMRTGTSRVVQLGTDILVQGLDVKEVVWFREGQPCDPPADLPKPAVFTTQEG